jgi:hypothetical protein
VTNPSEEGPHNTPFFFVLLCPQIRQNTGGEFKNKMLILLVIEPRLLVPWPVMLLAGLYQIVRADVVRTKQLNRDIWSEYVAIMKSKLMCTKLWFKLVVEERATERLRRYNTKTDS